MIRKIFYFTACWHLFGLAQADAQINIADYLVGQANDTLEFANLNGEALSPHFIFYQSADADLLQIEQDGYQMKQLINENGWQLSGIQWLEDLFLFEQPVTLLPARAKLRHTYTGNIPFHSNTVGNGNCTFQITMLGFESAETPLRNFVDCLKIQFVLNLQMDNQAICTIESSSWHARKYGLVKFIRKIKTTNEHQVVAALLKSAIIQGKPLDGNARN